MNYVFFSSSFDRYGAIVKGWPGEPVRGADAVLKREDHHACIHLQCLRHTISAE